MPAGEDSPRTRASSPSLQSSSSWSWMSRAAPNAAARFGRLVKAAAASPTTLMSAVMTFADTRVGSSAFVRYGDSRRMYSRPAQCSALWRSKISAGWPIALISASDGVGVRVDVIENRLLVEIEVLQDREAVGARGRRVGHRLCELLVAQAEVAVGARQAVAGQAGVELAGKLRAPLKVSREQRADARQLAVQSGVREEVVDGVHDLVVGAAARAAAARGGHREA